MANDRDPETNPAAFLGAELRRARLAAGISSHDKLAQMLGYDRSVIAKAETGERPPSEDVMKALVKVLGLDQVVTRLASLARRSTGIPAWFLDWVGIEREAATLHLAAGLDPRAVADMQVCKVRGPLTEYAGALGVISPSHCSRSPHGAGEGVSSARGLFRSW